MIAKKNLDLVVLAFVVLSLVLYDVTMEIYLELLHLVFEVFHNMFEWIELGIEHTVEHLFHTDRHGSQIVTFYILCAIAGYGFYRLWNAVPRLYQFFKQLVLASWARRKTQLQLYWLSLNSLHKVALAVAAVAVAYIASFFVM